MFAKNKILAVIVNYQSIYTETDTYKSLEILYEGHNYEICNVLVYDNSDSAKFKEVNSSLNFKNSNLIYYPAPANGGTQAAYLKALDINKAVQADWILLLDQDTRLPVNYLHLLDKNKMGDKFSIFLPKISCSDQDISPSTINILGRMTVCKNDIQNNQILLRKITGIASGVLIRPSVLLSLKIEESGLWLDYLDHWMFLRARRLGYKVGVLDIPLNHHLSIFNQLELSNERRFGILKSEYIFYQALGGLPILLYPLRVIFRIIRLFLVDYTCAFSFVIYSLRRMLAYIKL